MMKRRMGLVLAVMSNVTGLNRLTLLKTTSARLCQPPVVQKIPSLPSIDRYKFSKSTFELHIILVFSDTVTLTIEQCGHLALF